jgi:hypothetical protein
LKRNLPDRRGDALTLRGFVEILPRLKDKRTAVEMKLCGSATRYLGRVAFLLNHIPI